MSNQLIVLMKIIYSGALCQTAETERILMEEVGSAEPSTHNAEEEEDEEEVEDAGMTHYKKLYVIIALHWGWIHIKSITVGALCIVTNPHTDWNDHNPISIHQIYWIQWLWGRPCVFMCHEE